MRFVPFFILLLTVATSLADEAGRSAADVITHVTLQNADDSVTGRVVQEAADGSRLIEDRAGRLHLCPGAQVERVLQTQEPWRPFSREQMASHLLGQTGGGFAIRSTKHFVICSNASALYTDYCAKLLEHVVEQFQSLAKSLELQTHDLPTQLPVIVFRRSEQLAAFAQSQHPEVSFENVPGYYSLFHNQMLVAGLSGDQTFASRGNVVRELRRNLRQVETIVHEAVHQLAFNSGLQVRLADNPMWFSEGLAVYFEHASGAGHLLWSRPGGVNRIHHPTITRLADDGRFRLPLQTLVQTDAAFSSGDPATVAAAYAESWAIVHYLIRREPDALRTYVQMLQRRQPLLPVSPTKRWQNFTDAVQPAPDELEQRIIRHANRLRVR